MAETHIVAVDTYASQRVKDPQRDCLISAHKIGYSSAAAETLLTLFGTKARDVSPAKASYRYIAFDAETVVHHGYLLLALTSSELASAETVTRRYHGAAVYRWQDQQWCELPTLGSDTYTPIIGRSGPSFDPSGYRPTASATGERESAVNGIQVEKSQRSPNEKPWFWLMGDTYPHRDLLKRHGARFSGKRRAWYWVGWELPDAIRQLVQNTAEIEAPSVAVESVAASTVVMSPELQRQILAVLAQDDAERDAAPLPTAMSPVIEPIKAETLPADEKPTAIRILKPVPLPTDGTPMDPVQTAIRDTRTLPVHSNAIHTSNPKIGRIEQSYCGELTGSITGQVFSYGWAVHEGVCIYLNMAGPRVAVEAIRAKLSKGDQVSVVPSDSPAIELTAGEGNSGMYQAYLHYLPEARFASLILLHEWVVTPNYGGKSTTFIFRTSESQAMAKLKHHITQLVNVPVFDSWTGYLYQAGQRAMLVRKTRSAGGIDLLSVDLDVDAWTRLITGGLEQQIIQLPRSAL